MNESDNIILKVHRIDEDGTISSVQYEEDFITQEIISKTAIPTEDVSFGSHYNWAYVPENKVNLSFRYLEPDDSAVTVIKIGGVEDLNPLNYATEISTVLNDPDDCKPFIGSSSSSIKSKRESKIPNIPTMIRCQNCDTNFPTKYQYQRHQCEFNAEKVVLKPNADIKDIDKGMRIKYSCTVCGKEFVSKNNLERHQTSHDNTQENVCEHCNKQFVSENRLRIHKENHCKKAGDISKFYRSDVTVWKCVKCKQVFATPGSANKHTDICSECDNTSVGFKFEDNFQQQVPEELKSEDVDCITIVGSEVNGNKRGLDSTLLNNKNVERVLTELLLQCEYCNRTYADKAVLLLHQKSHSTESNYECVTCRETFDSYSSAAKHWMTKCSDEANLFYLPKMTYCEYCDRTFKSHELLYNHKNKKKHYTPKLHVAKRDSTPEPEAASKKTSESKDAIVKFIEDVLTKMDVPINKDFEQEKPDKSLDSSSNKENSAINSESVKEEALSQPASYSDNGDASVPDAEPEKKKRGRKRKWPKQASKTKRLTATVGEGFKYQCERCIKVFDSVVDLENHHDKEHASNFACEECGQVVHSAKALLIHSRAHQSLKPYVCEQCGRSYSQTSHLWQHMRFHQGLSLPFLRALHYTHNDKEDVFDHQDEKVILA